MDDLKARLRATWPKPVELQSLTGVQNYRVSITACQNVYRNPDGPEAADRIEQLEAELHQATNEINAMKDALAQCQCK